MNVNGKQLLHYSQSEKEQFVVFYGLNTKEYDAVTALNDLKKIDALQKLKFVLNVN